MIKDTIAGIRERIVRACGRSGRDPVSVTLVGVTKGRPVSVVPEAVEAGLADIGENRVQEALLKYRELVSLPAGNPKALKWHMIGHLQTNKVKDAVRVFDLIHSVDSRRLAEEIDKEAGKAAKIQDILIEVKTSPEATKYGVAPEAAAGLLEEIARLKNIRVCGLMTIAPAAPVPEDARPYFRRLRHLRDDLGSAGIMRRQADILSMGMSDDFEVAIEEGSTMVRIGRALF